MSVDPQVIRKLSDENKAFQERFNQVAGIINKNQSYLKGVQDLDNLDPDQNLALECLKEADFDLDKAINMFIEKKVDGDGIKAGEAEQRSTDAEKRSTDAEQSDEMSPSRPSGTSVLRGTADVTADVLATAAPFVASSTAWDGALKVAQTAASAAAGP